MRSFGFCATLFLWLFASCADGEEPLHRQIDHLIEQAGGGNPAERPSTDAEFMRRVYLDFAGRIPTVREAREFLTAKSPTRRTDLIDQLLASPDYPRRMRELFNAMLMERRPTNDHWQQFLTTAFEENMPWDQLARAILDPDSENEKLRGAAHFYTARLVSRGAMTPVDVPGLTRDAGRLLAGVDLQCAQCHDHLTVDAYLQEDFQGLHIVFENIAVRRDTKFPAVSEKLLTEPIAFMSVFYQESRTTPLRIPGGTKVDIPSFPAGEEYVVAPDRKKKIVGVPKFSPLAELARGLASAENPMFCRNIANRLWFINKGRGLVEPLDLHHAENPASHPELLELLATDFAAHEFDMKYLLRELALSATYQQTSQLAGDQIPPVTQYQLALEKPLSAEQLYWSTLVASEAVQVLHDDQSPNLEQLVSENDRLQQLKKLFLKSFANPPQEPEVAFAPSVKGALFLMHEESVQELLLPGQQGLLTRLGSIEDSEACLRELFLAVLSRYPTAEEVTEFAGLLKTGDERTDTLQQLAWAMLASTEFCLNH